MKPKFPIGLYSSDSEFSNLNFQQENFQKLYLKNELKRHYCGVWGPRSSIFIWIVGIFCYRCDHNNILWENHVINETTTIFSGKVQSYIQHIHNDMSVNGRYWGPTTISRYIEYMSDWYSSVPFGTPRYHSVPISSPQYRSVPLHTIRWPSVPFRTPRYYLVPFRTPRYNRVEGTHRYHLDIDRIELNP